MLVSRALYGRKPVKLPSIMIVGHSSMICSLHVSQIYWQIHTTALLSHQHRLLPSLWSRLVVCTGRAGPGNSTTRWAIPSPK